MLAGIGSGTVLESRRSLPSCDLLIDAAVCVPGSAWVLPCPEGEGTAISTDPSAMPRPFGEGRPRSKVDRTPRVNRRSRFHLVTGGFTTRFTCVTESFTGQVRGGIDGQRKR